MATGDWKNILKSQNDDIERLQAMDAELEQNNNISEIDKVINKKSSGLNVRTTSKANATNKNVPPIPEPNIDNEFSGDVPDYYDVYNDTEVDYYRSENVTPTSLNKRKGTIDNSVEKSFQSPMNAASRAPETENRYAKAKLKLLTQQNEELSALKLSLTEQNRSLTTQLKMERDEKAKLQKRVQLLETEFRKQGTASRRGSDAGAQLEKDTARELMVVKKDLETVERLAKQHESSAKTKDTQLKRAAETISRLKAQLSEAQLQLQSGESGEKSKTEAAEARIKVLEKQRAELIDGFKKQMKLIDILKRQKVHIEAARLLAFTEEEFMQTLDWKV